MNIKKEIHNKTKIVVTMGPAVDDEDILRNIIKSGADIFRLNFSHGSYTDHLKRIKMIRKVEKQFNLLIPILLDLQGPKIRIGDLEEDFIEIKKNQELIIDPDIKVGSKAGVSISFKDLYKFVKKNDKILVDDGLIKFRVVSVDGKKITLKSINEGIIKPHKGVNLPDTKLPIPALTEKDKNDLRFGLEHNINAVALSFVRKKSDIIELKKFIKKYRKEDDSKITIIAKIEKPEAVKNIKEIIEEVDGIMVARGDLGVETSPQSVPEIQKKLIRLAFKRNKFVITATQMLESMIHNRIPTRAETTDVFNAVLDGTDAVMLSGETAVGEHPVETVKTMADIVFRAETYYHDVRLNFINDKNEVDRLLITNAAICVTSKIHPKFIATFSASGKTAVYLAKTRPKSRLIVFVFDKSIAYYLRFFYAVFTFVVPIYKNTDEMIKKVNTFFKEKKIGKKGDVILLTFGSPVGKNTETNTLKIHTIE